MASQLYRREIRWSGQSSGATRSNGYGAWSGAAFYLENTQIPAADVTWERNIVYGPVDGFECEWGGANSGVSSTCRIYNNTAYLGAPSAVRDRGRSELRRCHARRAQQYL